MRGKKTSEEKREQVKAVIYLNPEASNRDIAKQTGIPHTTVQEIKKDCKEELNSDEYVQHRAIKKQEFIDNAFNIALQGLEVAKKKFDNLNNVPEQLQKANVRDIAIALGTIYDKQALASGEPTQINESRKPIGELVDEFKAKAKELDRLVSGQ